MQKKKRIISVETQDYLVGGLLGLVFLVLCGLMFEFLFSVQIEKLVIVLCLMVADFICLIAYAGRKQIDE